MIRDKYYYVDTNNSIKCLANVYNNNNNNNNNNNDFR